MNRYDFKKRGQRFVVTLLLILVAVILLYVVSHLVFDPETNIVPLDELVFLDEKGRFHIRDAGGVLWFIGEDIADPIFVEARERYDEMYTLDAEIRAYLDEFRTASLNSYSNTVADILSSLETGDYGPARVSVRVITEGLDDEISRGIIDPNLLWNISRQLERLALLKSEQEALYSKITPPLIRTFFWTTPTLSIIEVLFWAAFGVLTNLLVNSAEYLRTNKFRPAERWVAYTKLAYGPILSMILVIAIMNGWFDIGGYKVRVWTLPLLGFIFGYATRRTAALFDGLVSAVLRKAEESIETGPEPTLRRRAEAAQMLMESARPSSVKEFGTQAKAIADRVVRDIVTEKEAGA